MKNLKPLLVLIIASLISAISCAHKNPSGEGRSHSSSQSGYAPVNGLKMYYEVHGQGEPLVLIHGGGSTIESNFALLIPILSQNRQIIAMEEQGHGHTQAIDRPFTFENSADDVAALLSHLQIDKADVLGFSNGGNIAMRLAQRHPTRVNRLIVASAMYRRDGMVKGFWDGFKNAKLEDMPQSLQDADRKINPDPKHLEQLFMQDSKRMAAFKNWPDSDLKKIKAPTLILNGDKDVVLSEHALKMSRLIPDARLAILPMGHGDYLGEVSASNKQNRQYEATAILIQDFLSAK